MTAQRTPPGGWRDDRPTKPAIFGPLDGLGADILKDRMTRAIAVLEDALPYGRPRAYWRRVVKSAIRILQREA